MVDTWRDVSQVFEIMDKVKNHMFGENISFFSGLNVGEKEGDKERNPSLLSAILEVPSIGIRRANN